MSGNRVNGCGTFCISVDQYDTGSPLAAQRGQDVVQLLHEFQLPSSWSVEAAPDKAMPIPHELSLVVPKGISRGDFVAHLRQTSATLFRDGLRVSSMVIDPHEIPKVWDVLVRQGCSVARPRSAAASTGTAAQLIRGGLWYAPMSCSFVGGSRRTVRSLAKVCQKRLVQAMQTGQLFHLNVELGNERKSWTEELGAIRTLLQTSQHLQKMNICRCVPLSQIGETRTNLQPQVSVLRRAA